MDNGYAARFKAARSACGGEYWHCSCVMNAREKYGGESVPSREGESGALRESLSESRAGQETPQMARNLYVRKEAGYGFVFYLIASARLKKAAGTDSVFSFF